MTKKQKTYKTKTEAQKDPRAKDDKYIMGFRIEKDGSRTYSFREISEIPYMYNRDARF